MMVLAICQVALAGPISFLAILFGLFATKSDFSFVYVARSKVAMDFLEFSAKLEKKSSLLLAPH